MKQRSDGFRPAEIAALDLNVGDNVGLRLVLRVPRVGESVTISAEAARVSASPAVSTVVDRTLVGNLPLNGRSFQSLITMTPGVVLSMATSSLDRACQSRRSTRTTSAGSSADPSSAIGCSCSSHADGHR
jgi:hypothetical protein